MGAWHAQRMAANQPDPAASLGGPGATTDPGPGLYEGYWTEVGKTLYGEGKSVVNTGDGALVSHLAPDHHRPERWLRRLELRQDGRCDQDAVFEKAFWGARAKGKSLVSFSKSSAQSRRQKFFTGRGPPPVPVKSLRPQD